MVYSRYRLAVHAHKGKVALAVTALTAALLLTFLWPTVRVGSASEGAGDSAHDRDQALPWLSSSSQPPGTVDQVRAKVLLSGVLKGTQVAGSWSIGPDGQPYPSLALRERFEYYLLGLGDATPAQLRDLIGAEAEAALGAKTAKAIMALFDRHWALRMHAPRNQMSLEDRSTWPAAFEEQKALRRQYLGSDWAQAFYGEEEALFERALAGDHPSPQQASVPDREGGPVPIEAPGSNPQDIFAKRQALYGEAAAQRLAKVDAEWAEWEQRLEGAKTVKANLFAALELSDLQRKQRFEAHVRQNFKPSDQARVMGLLGWP